MSEEKLKTYNEIVFKNENGAEGIALERAWKVRNFEIELYWKRALYFWGFIALSFTWHFFAIKEGDNALALIASYAGLVFSIAWFLVNKASKFWQENWEAHIDCLEDAVEGNLYKTVLKNKTGLWNPLKAYHFSVSKINQAINLFIALIWISLICTNPLYEDFSLLNSIKQITNLKYLLPVAALCLIAVFLLFCRTSFKGNKGACENDFKPLKNCKYKYFYRSIDKN
jgi:hypothetical protein